MGSLCSKTSAVDLVVEPNESRDEPGTERELSPMALCASMQASLTTGTRNRSLIKKFPKCFAGHEAVHWMLERKQARDAGEAVRKCQTLLGRGMLEQVDGAAEFDDDPKRFYRFTAAQI
ncbi:crystallin j1a-like [Phytophthora cinnamomi]|uniref:crystallin j1a-like n=1 Tax=Phytophthora cinnamomi TaxID=4785 RepID=UPI00355A5C92|nr:crystallin j1a-like [Phytophthora cinnamomi]